MTDLAERLREHHKTGMAGMAHADVLEAAGEIERLTTVLQALHDWNVEYARINNLFNADGSPATFHELLEARRILEGKP